MITTLEELESNMRVAPTNGRGTTAIKSVLNVHAVQSYQLITESRFASNEKIDNKVAEEYLNKHKGSLARIGWNKASTDVYIKVK